MVHLAPTSFLEVFYVRRLFLEDLIYYTHI